MTWIHRARERLGRRPSFATVLARPEVLAAMLALLPIALAVARAVTTEWIPVQDNAIVEIRSRDVLSIEHFPLLGTWSSASLTAGVDLNHPGPLLFDLLAPFVAVFGGGPGIALGIGLLNASAVVGCAVTAWRVGGRSASIIASLVAATLSWTLGSMLLIDPWNPHPMVLPCWWMLLLTWAVASGDLRSAPWLVAVASLCLQVHLGYAYLAPACVLLAALGAAVVFVRRRRVDPSCRVGDGARLRRAVTASMLVGLVAWAAPIGEQVFGAGRGNLARILGSTGGDEPTIGVALAARIVAKVVALPPWWGRSSFTESVPYAPIDAAGTVTPVGLPGTGGAVLVLLVVLATLAVLGIGAWRRRDRPTTVALALSGAFVMVAVAALAVSPFGPLGLTPHQMRWLWSVAACLTFALVFAVVRAVAARRPRGEWRAAEWLGVAAVALMSVINLPAYVQPAGPATFSDLLPSARALRAAMLEYRPAGPVEVATDDLRFGEIYSTVVMSALDEAGVEVRVRDNGWVRQLGEYRRVDGTEVVVLHVVEGVEAVAEREGAVRVALVNPPGDRGASTVAVFAVPLTPTVVATP